jgi:hypothetical protein
MAVAEIGQKWLGGPLGVTDSLCRCSGAIGRPPADHVGCERHYTAQTAHLGELFIPSSESPVTRATLSFSATNFWMAVNPSTAITTIKAENA